MQPKKEIQHPPLKTFEKMCLKEQHPTELQSRNPGPRSNKTNGISSMHPPRSRGSFVVFMSCTFTIFEWFRRVNNLHLLLFYLQYPPTCLPCLLHPLGSNYACNFSIFSIPHLFACFTTHTGSELHVTACITLQFSWSHHPFTWLQTLL